MDIVTNFYPISGNIEEIKTGEKYINNLKNNEISNLSNLINDMEKESPILKINLIGIYQNQKIVSGIKYEKDIVDLFNYRFNEYLRSSSFIFNDLIAVGYNNDIIEASILREFIGDKDSRLILIPYMQLLTIDFEKKKNFDMQDYDKEMSDLTIEIMREINPLDFDIKRYIKQLSKTIGHKKKFFEEGIELYTSNLKVYGLTFNEYITLFSFKKALDIIENPDKPHIILLPPGMNFDNLNGFLKDNKLI